MSYTQKLFGTDAEGKFRHFFSIMLPILITQTAIMGMNFFDTIMSGHAGAEQLAGTSIGGNLWMPVFTTINGILIAATPLTAHLLGAGQRRKTGRIVCHGLCLAILFSVFCFIAGSLFLQPFINSLGLEPQVAHIAVYYLAGVGIGIIPFFMGTVLRAFIDTLGGTRLTMQVYLAALPVNGALNIRHHSQYRDIKIFREHVSRKNCCSVAHQKQEETRSDKERNSSLRKGDLLSETERETFLSKTLLLEYLRIGVPIGLSIFMETSIFGVVAFLVARFGTAAIAASQASMNFASLLYMLPLSVSMSMTILTGIEAGARRWRNAEQYGNAGLAFNWTCALVLPALCYLMRYPIAHMYVTEPEVIDVCVRFLTYGCLFTMGDAVAAPIQGILRGYKDVNAPFYSSLIAYWGICAPLGLYFDYMLNHGPYSYWQSLDIGIFVSALILFLRLLHIRRKLRRENEIYGNTD